jgi:hypothetical protein
MELPTGVLPIKRYYDHKIVKLRNIILSLKYALSYPFLVCPA